MSDTSTTFQVGDHVREIAQPGFDASEMEIIVIEDIQTWEGEEPYCLIQGTDMSLPISALELVYRSPTRAEHEALTAEVELLKQIELNLSRSVESLLTDNKIAVDALRRIADMPVAASVGTSEVTIDAIAKEALAKLEAE